MGSSLSASARSEGDLQTIPFVVLSTDVAADLLCEVTPDNKHIFFESSMPMNLYTDCEVLYALACSINKWFVCWSLIWTMIIPAVWVDCFAKQFSVSVFL